MSPRKPTEPTKATQPGAAKTQPASRKKSSAAASSKAAKRTAPPPSGAARPGEPLPCPRCGKPHARCKAHRRDGEPCTMRPMRGQKVCRMHGGKSKGAVTKAEREMTEQQARALVGQIWNPDAPPVTDAVAALQKLAGAMGHSTEALGALVGSGHGDPCEVCGRADVELDSAAGVAWLRQQQLYRQLLADMGRLNLDQRAVDLEAARADLVVSAVGAAFDAAELSEEQRVLASQVLMSRLRAGTTVPGEVATSREAR